MTEASLRAALDALQAAHGPVGAAVSLLPAFQSEDGSLFDPTEERIARHVFLLAKHLTASITQSARDGFGAFVTVTRMDGCLGMDHEASGTVSGGLIGLAKTLNHEWDAVFCRSVDLHPALDADSGAARLLAELHDPDLRLTEVGHDGAGRVTRVGVIEANERPASVPASNEAVRG